MKDALLLTASCLNAVRNRMDEITVQREAEYQRHLLQDEAYDIVHSAVRAEVDYDANKIPTYLERFPDLLKVQSGGGDLNGEIEQSLHRSYIKLIRPHLNALLLTQYGDFTLESITKTLVDTDKLLKTNNTQAVYLFSKAVMQLQDNPDHDVLGLLITRTKTLAKEMTPSGFTHTGEGLNKVPVRLAGPIHRLNEIGDYLDLLLEGDGFDALLTPNNAPKI
jgi:hypothetical protein